MQIIVIGAGVAGLACARRLSDAGKSVTLLDKGRGVGGRVATRRRGAAQFDHGAQYATVRDPGFAQVIARAERAGQVARWPDASDPPRYVGVPGMTALAKHVAEGLDLRLETPVRSIRATANGFRVTTAGEPLTATHLVCTAPAPQTLALLGADHPLAADLQSIRYAPCLTLMASLARRPEDPVTRRDPDAPLSWIAVDSTKPDRPHGVHVVAQAGPGLSRRYLEDDPETQRAALGAELAKALAIPGSDILDASVHRWRYSSVETPLGRPFARHGRLWFGGDGCLGSRVEKAWLSGDAIARDILQD